MGPIIGPIGRIKGRFDFRKIFSRQFFSLLDEKSVLSSTFCNQTGLCRQEAGENLEEGAESGRSRTTRMQSGRMRATGWTKTGRSGVSQDGTGAFPPPQQPPLFDNARVIITTCWMGLSMPARFMHARIAIHRRLRL